MKKQTSLCKNCNCEINADREYCSSCEHDLKIQQAESQREKNERCTREKESEHV